MKTILNIILFFSILISLSACDPSVNPCTSEFTTIYITVNKYKLDSCHTIRLSNFKTYYFKNQSNIPNQYPVVDDTYLSVIRSSNNLEEIRFLGFIKDKVVVDETMYVYADPCHVRVTGNDLIID